jgi:hypothetical protein
VTVAGGGRSAGPRSILLARPRDLPKGKVELLQALIMGRVDGGQVEMEAYHYPKMLPSPELGVMADKCERDLGSIQELYEWLPFINHGHAWPGSVSAT